MSDRNQLGPTESLILLAIHEFDYGRFYSDWVNCANVLIQAIWRSGRITEEAVVALSLECEEWVPLAEEFDQALVRLVNDARDGAWLVEGEGNFGCPEAGRVPSHPIFRECRLSEAGKAAVINLPESLMLMPAVHLFAVFRRCGLYAALEIVSLAQFSDLVFDRFAVLDRVHADVIPALWELLAPSIRDGFVSFLRHAARPDFRYHPERYADEIAARTDEELRRDSEVATSSVQAWAGAFVRFLDERKG